MATGSIVSSLTFVGGVLCVCCQSGTCSPIADEENLRSSLFANYNTKIKPEGKTSVMVATYIASLIYLDIASQYMSVSLMFDLSWNDSRLAWNRTDFGNLTKIVTPPEDIWTPPVVIDNAIEDVGVLGGKNKGGIPVSFSELGLVSWIHPVVATTSCETLISNYPFDTQRCNVIFAGWAYPTSEMELIPRFIDSSFIYSPNGEFDLTNTRTSMAFFGVSDGNTYQKVQLEFSFRRRWKFYCQNMILPIVLSSILMNTAFLVPVETGEKLGYTLTVLLSYVVLLTLVTENLPPISTDTSILQVYLAIVLCLGCVSTLLTIWVLRLYHTDAKKPVTPFYLTFARRILAPFSQCFFGRAGNRVTDQKEAKGRGDVVTQEDCDRYSAEENEAPSSESSLPTPRNDPRRLISARLDPAGKKVPEEIGNAWEATSRRPAYTWPELAVLLDLFCFRVFALVLLVLTVAVVTLLYVNY